MGIFSIVLIVSVFLGYPAYDDANTSHWSFGMKEFEKGIPVDFKFTNSIEDTTITIQTKIGSIGGSDKHAIQEYLNQQLAITGNQIVDVDTLTLRYEVFDWRNMRNENLKLKKNLFDIKGGLKLNNETIYLQPGNLQERLILMFPIILLLFLMSYCGWQFAMFLQYIQSGSSFDQSNYKRLRNIGLALFYYNFLLLFFNLYFLRFTVAIRFESNKPGFKSPLNISGNPDLHYGYLYFMAGCIFLVLASAFKKGHQLQKEQDLTI